jgi:subtilisin family serine protease
MPSSKSMGSPVIAVAALLAAACADIPTQPADGVDDGLTPAATVLTAQDGRYLVWMMPGSGVPRNLTGVLANTGARVVHDLRQIGFLVVDGLPSGAASVLAARSDVRGVTPDFVAQWIPPADELMGPRVKLTGEGGAIQGTDQTGAFFFPQQWNIRQIRADQAYGATPTGAGALVCVLDSGIDPGQVDMVGNVDLSKSISFIATEPYIEDLNFHGTFVAGIITSNGLGVASIAPDAKLCAVKVLAANGTGPIGAVLAGLVHAADVGADVANMSLGIYVPRNAPGVDILIAAFRAAVVYAREHRMQVVAAAGNEGANLDEDGDMISIPAEIPGVLSVAATAPFNQMNFDALASYSNFGGRKGGVDLAAPGGDYLMGGVVEDLVISICSRFVCGADGFFVFASGTSAASPHVAAVGAVAESHLAGNQNAKALDDCILLNVTPILRPNGQPDLRYGAGRLDALAGGQCLRR